jgi:hypothetical protein
VLPPDPVALMLVKATFAGGRGVYPFPTAQALAVWGLASVPWLPASITAGAVVVSIVAVGGGCCPPTPSR